MKNIKIIGLAATVVGAIATVVSSYASGKEQERLISEKVAEAIAKSQEK